MRLMLRILTCVVGVFVILASLSYVTTAHPAEGYWPPASLQIRVIDAGGLPVEGARLSLWLENVRLREFQQSRCYTSNWTSNKNGIIDLLVKPSRWPVTGSSLFWLIPFEESNPDLEARFIAPRFKPAIVALRTLINDAEFKGHRPVEKAEEAKGFFSDDDFNILHATVVLKSTGRD